MTLGELLHRLQTELSSGRAKTDSPVIVEGEHRFRDVEEDLFIQADVIAVKGETRCEDEDEPPGLYITIEEPEEDG